MPKIDRIFTGGLDLDTDSFRVSANMFIDALNVTLNAKGSGQDKVLTNINSNQQIAYSLPAGTNKCIGGYGDRVRNRFYYFVYNSNGNHTILYYNGLTNAVVKLLTSKTDSDGIDILNFSPSYRVLSINIINNDVYGDIIFFNDGYNPPRSINTISNYGTSWKSEYLDVAKEPPVMPPKCTYENDTTITVNNLRNSLFQFRYRFVYDDNQKSVWGSAGIVPLPFQPSANGTADTFTNNSRISVSMSTGGAQVIKIELAVRQTTNGITSDWLLVKSLIKINLSISNNDIYTFKFYNDGVYVPIDIKDIGELQDYVPQLADAAELLNGSNLIYGGITEGYDIVNASMSIDTTGLSGNPFPYDYNGTLFFATISGLDSGSQGTTMKVYLYGTGTNTAGAVTTLNNGASVYKIFAQNSSFAAIGASYTNATDNPTVASVLAGISAALVVNGWTQVSIVGNIATFTFPTTVTLDSSGTYTTGVGFESPTNYATTHLTYPYQSAQSVGIQYFDSKGRTNGVVVTAQTSYTLPPNNGTTLTPQLIINSRPPLWATYYQVVRTPNLTYNYRLDWVTNGAYSDASANILGVRYAYLEIDNIIQYNQLIESTVGVVGYEFQKGDRVRIIGRYNANGSAATLNAIYDYEVLGTVQSFTSNGVTKTGNYLKIYYPTADIDANFKFDGTGNFLSYEILIYNYTKHQSDTNQPYFEFGKCFGIGNAGTTSAYHIGQEQTQSVNLATPAKITIANGDYFSRKRTVPIGQTGLISATGISNGFYYVRPVTTISPTITNSLYTIQSATGAQANPPLVPDYTSGANFFLNLSATDSITVRLRAKIPITVDLALSTSVLATISTPGPVEQVITLITPIPMYPNVGYVIDLDSYVIVPPNGYLNMLIVNSANVVNQNIGSYDLTVDVITNVTIQIIESSFSDIYSIVTNSNGRPSVIEENAKQERYKTLVRFSGSYLQDTNVNNTNRFTFDDADEYDANFGAIVRFHVRDRYLITYQNFKVARVPILTQIVQDTSGNPLQAQSDRLINKIQYYQGDYGIGFSGASLAWNNFADYFVDDVRGVVCRLSQDGIEPLSVLYKTNAFFSDVLRYFRTDLNTGYTVTGGNPSVLGVFDPYTNKYIIALEQIDRYTGSTLVFHQDPYTICFDENTNTFESFYSYHPEMMGVLNTLVITFTAGGIWLHNSSTYCNFFGVQYACSVTLVFNDIVMLKKTFTALIETGTTVWVAQTITTSLNSYGTTKQASNLIASDFSILESTYNAPFRRDTNSIGGLINGDALKGEYIIIKLQVNSANTTVLVGLNSASVHYLESNLNIR